VSLPFSDTGLRLDQAPPLSIPAAFFLIAPASVVAAGIWLLVQGGAPLGSGWDPTTVILTHLATLGFLAAVMLGALYQMIPVVAGVPVPGVKAAYGVLGLFVAGLVTLLIGLAAGPKVLIIVGGSAVLAALVLFLVPVAFGMLRGAARTMTVAGMALSLLSLATVLFLGLWMAWGHATGRFPGPRNWWVQVHLCVGLLGWVGMLITSVSWQVVPMFYLAPEPGRTEKVTILVLALLGVATPVVLLLLGPSPVNASKVLAMAAAPAVVAVWLVQPLSTLIRIARRTRRRPDASLLFWRFGLVIALLLPALAVLAVLSRDLRWPVLLGWLAAWGWAGAIVHGMLGRIVSFLVWFHRFSPLIGKVPVPSMRKLLPEKHVRVSFALHATSVVLGSAAIVFGTDVLAWLTGAALLATGISLAAALVRTLRSRPEPVVES
jgi:hypothetical protein